MESTLNKIKGILKKEIGLDASTIGAATIDKIINERLRSCQIQSLDEYYAYLTKTPTELNLLLETAVIPETWFFRDDKPFKLILNKISRQLVHEPNKRSKILCIPCSTGEEPYSISIYLHDNGIPDTAYDIHAVDISMNSISIARRANYTRNSFRGDTAKLYCDKYFTKNGSTYDLNNDIKTSVTFNQLNILDAIFSPEHQYDFILCRNLLIYFDLPTKERAYKNLHRFLNHDGKLFIGHSEFGSVPRDIFNIVKYDSVFCLIKDLNPAPKDIQNPVISNTLKKAKPAVKMAFSDISKYNINDKTKTPSNAAQKINKKPEKNSGDKLIKQARALADSGKFSAAESLCLEYIDEHNDHEETFFLLGLISEASNNSDQAEKFFKKALYMNPKHYETLIHLSFILQSHGDIDGSKRLKERAERASEDKT